MKRPLVLLTGLLLAQSLLTRPTTAQSTPPPAPSWEGQIVYQVMPDRFFDGDTGNDAGVDRAAPQAWHGGDVAGLTQKLGYITGLGATALWLTPVYPQVAPVNGMAGYHGYWPADFRAVDPHFGTLAQVGTLVQKAHQAGLKVMLDSVINHYGYGAPAVQAHPAWFHTQQGCDRAAADEKDSVCALAGLPDLNQSVPEVESLLAGNADFWRAQGIDAFRYDAVKNVDQEFLRAQVARDRAAGTYTLGEYYGADADRVSEYQKLGLSSLFEFSLQDALKRSLMGGQSLEAVRAVLAQDAAAARPGEIALFLDNHDLPRFASGSLFEDQGQARTAYALQALMTLKGVPVIWQGTEYALQGGPDPDNRRDMRFPETWTEGEQAVYAAAKDAISVRKASAALSRGDQKLLPVPDAAADELLAFTRQSGQGRVLVAWNNAKTRQTYSLDRVNLADQPLTASLLRPLAGGAAAGLSVRGKHVYLSLNAGAVAVFPLLP